MEIQENRFAAGIVTINYAEISSANTPLVLLHGGSARWQSFDTILADLAATWHVYSPDLRGHGQSTWVTGSYRLQDYTDDTMAFLQHCVKEPAYLFGHSLGGEVALLVAAQYPAGVRAVAVGDAPLSSQSWRATLLEGRDRVLAWRDLAGGQQPFANVVEALKNAPIKAPDKTGVVPMHALKILRHYKTWKLWLKETRNALPQPWPQKGEGRLAADGSEHFSQSRLLHFDPLEQQITRQVRLEKWLNGALLAAEEYTLWGRMYFKNDSS